MADWSIELRNLEKRYPNSDRLAVNGINLAVPKGAFLVMLGPSGCGKTTVLRMLAGLEDPTGGDVRFNGEVVASGLAGVTRPPGQRDAGLVFQSYALWPHMTVAQNVAWPLRVRKWAGAERDARVREVLDLLGIGHLAARYPGEVSGGEQQRVAIARMIAPRPSILLFDEPLSNLDAKLRMEMRSELLRVHRLTNATSVYVTHDQVEAMTMASHVAVMRKGNIEQFGAPHELLERPCTPFVAGFIGTPPANLLPVSSRGGYFCFRSLPLTLADSTHDKLLMYRAESLALHQEPGHNRLPVEFAEATPVAGRAIVTVWSERMRINVVSASMPHASLGDRLYLSFPAHPDIAFNPEG
jgi:iron(III) transport system ATP-binding protein